MKNSVFPVDLVEIVKEKDGLNQEIEKTRTTKTIYAEISSVSQTEFFEGGRLGFQPSLKATIYDFEYNGEPVVKYPSNTGKLYSVYRVYFVNGSDRAELYLEERGGTKDEPVTYDSTP